MKNNHQQVENFIRQAIAACSYDSRLSETKTYLAAALNAVGVVTEKRNRHAASQKAFDEGKKKADEWWEMLKKNAANNFKINIDEYETDE